MIIGVPCARTANESRVGLTPSAAGALVRAGHLVVVGLWAAHVAEGSAMTIVLVREGRLITLASERGIAPVTRVDGRAVGSGEPVYGSAGVPCSGT